MERTAQSHYLVVYKDGTLLGDVHEMLDRATDRDGNDNQSNINGIYVITPDGNVTEVLVEDVLGQTGREFEISEADTGTLVEYVCYAAADSNDLEGHELYVDGFPHAPGV